MLSHMCINMHWLCEEFCMQWGFLLMAGLMVSDMTRNILTFAVVFQNQDSLSSLQSIAQQAVTSAGLDARVTSPAQRTDPSSECCVE